MNKAFFLVLVVVLFPSFSHAETEAEKVFGKWEKVTVATMTKPCPEWVYGTNLPGSVTNDYRQMGKPLECPIYQSGRVVGYRTNCFPASDS